MPSLEEENAFLKRTVEELRQENAYIKERSRVYFNNSDLSYVVLDAHQMIVDVNASAGTDPPIAEIPMKIASKEPPMTIPVLISPSASPIIGPATIGLLIVCQPTRKSPTKIR